jgi:hypothetical protein
VSRYSQYTQNSETLEIPATDNQHGWGLIITDHVRQNEISHFPWNARNARAPSILIWTTMRTRRKDCSYDRGWFTVHLCVASLKISMIRGTGAARCLLTLTFLVTLIRTKNHQPHRHNCTCLVPVGVSGVDIHTLYAWKPTNAPIINIIY